MRHLLQLVHQRADILSRNDGWLDLDVDQRLAIGEQSQRHLQVHLPLLPDLFEVPMQEPVTGRDEVTGSVETDAVRQNAWMSEENQELAIL